MAQTKPSLLTRHLADYDAELRRGDGRVDTDLLVQRLQDLGVTTYYWLIWHAATDWEDLKLFLPKAAQAHINVWAYLVPPTEGPPGGYPASEPFKLDYLRWAEEIARLSLQDTNLTAWVIDDFYANHQFFTPAYVRDMQSRARQVNPRLAFLPLMYFREITPQFVNGYHEVVDGVVVAYPNDREEILNARAILNGTATTLPCQLGCPWNTPTQAGDFVRAGIPVRVVSAERARLQVRERDDFTGPTAGYHFKQVLIDDKVIWEADAVGGNNGWQAIDLDLSAAMRGKTNVTLAFRLFDKKGVSNFGLRWHVKELRLRGLEPAATLEAPQKWQVEQRGPFEAGFGEVAQPRAERRFQIPFVVMTAGSADEFRLRHGDPASPERIAEWLRMSLQTWQEGQCDGVVTYCLDKGPSSKSFPLARQLFRQFQKQR